MIEDKNLSDFEKLLFATKYIEMLKHDIELLEDERDEFNAIIKQRDIKIGKLQSKIDELEYKFKLEKPDEHKLEAYKEHTKAMQAKLVICKKDREMYQLKYLTLKRDKSK